MISDSDSDSDCLFEINLELMKQEHLILGNESTIYLFIFIHGIYKRCI